MRYGRRLAVGAAVLATCWLLMAAGWPAEESGSAVRRTRLPERVALLLRKSGWPDPVIVFVIAMLPILELRGAIPAAHVLGMNPWAAYLIAVAGNMAPIPLILLGLGPLSRWGMRWKPGKIFFNWLFARTRRKTAAIEKYETLGLTIFVAIPLPVTGAWTGSVAAFLLGVKFHHAMVSILLGVMVAGVIMTTLSVMGWWGAAVAAIVLGALAVSGILGMFRREEARSDV